MRITHLGHSAVLVETDLARLLIDPGTFSTAWHGLTDLDAVLVSHAHPDHADPDHLPALVAANPRARLLVEPSMVASDASGPFPDLGAGALGPGDQVVISDLLVEAVGGQHAVIHRDLPSLGNVGFVLRSDGQPTFFHPGDSLTTVPSAVDVLAVPAYGPWAAMKETIDFVRSVNALEGFAIHDELLSDRGRALISARVGEMTSTRLIDLRGGTPHDF